ncbi:MAG: lipopolysaccharide assembly protein LapA domain-containing protein [Solirubrobacterales bacterium]
MSDNAPGGEQRTRRRWGLICGGAILLIFMALNSQRVTVHFVFTTVNMPLIFALLIAALLGALLGWAVPRLRAPRQ